MTKKIATIGCMLALSILSTNVSANLITNGSFEDGTPGLTGTQWQVYDSITGWDTHTGAGIEIQRNTVVGAQDGDQYVELDSHGAGSNSFMIQELNNLSVGSWYDLSFWYHARTNNGSNDNGINAYWGGPTASDLIEISDIHDLTIGTSSEWINYEYSIQATHSTMFLGFEADGSQNTLGGFIDNVSVTAVPEPSTLALFGLGIVGLGLSRRRSKLS